MIPFITDLPAPIDHDAQDFYGPMTEANKAKALYVVHITAGTPHDGSGTHNWMHTNPSNYRWHRGVGTGGQLWRCTGGRWGLPNTLRLGAHDAGINDFSVGCEHTGNCDDDFRDYPKMLNASARDIAEFAIHVKKQRPSRGKPVGDGWIIGHADDEHYGGISLHVDPNCGKTAPPPWMWTDYLALCNVWYDYLTEEEHMGLTEPQAAQLAQAADNVAEILKLLPALTAEERAYFKEGRDNTEALQRLATHLGIDASPGKPWANLLGERLAAVVEKVEALP